MSLSRVPWLIVISMAFAIGVVIGAWLSPPSLWLFIALLGSLILILWPISLLRLFGIVSLFIVLGVFRLSLAQPTSTPESGELVFYHGEKVTLEGVVVSEPVELDFARRYEVSVRYLLLDDMLIRLGGQVLVRTSKYPVFQYGDWIAVHGKVEDPPEFEDFSYREYLARQGIYSYMNFAEVELLESGQGNVLVQRTYELKSAFENQINVNWTEPESSLLAGLLIGSRRGFTEDFENALRKTGTTHIIAISGSNITLIIVLLKLLVDRWLSRGYQVILFTLGVSWFVLLVGASASVVRAALMGLIIVFASAVNRRSHLDTALFGAGGAMLMWNPWSLWDVGFQLSFLATASIIWIFLPLRETIQYQAILHFFDLYLSERLEGDKEENDLNFTQENEDDGLLTFLTSFSEKMYSVWSRIWQVGFEAFVGTIVAQILVTPLIMSVFGDLSLVSPLSNVLVLWPIPIIMLFGFAGVMLSVISWWIAWPVILFSWLGLRYMVWVIETLAGWPGAQVGFGDVPLWLVLLWYAIWATFILWIKRRQYFIS